MVRSLAIILLAGFAILGLAGLRPQDVLKDAELVVQKAQEVVEVMRGDSEDVAGLGPTATPTPDGG